MSWQYITVGLIVALAAGYLLRKSWRTWSRRQSGCGGGCGCASKTAANPATNGDVVLIAPEQLTLRRRNTGSL